MFGALRNAVDDGDIKRGHENARRDSTRDRNIAKDSDSDEHGSTTESHDPLSGPCTQPERMSLALLC